MTKFARLGVYAKVYVHSNDNDKKKRANGTKFRILIIIIILGKLQFEDYENCQEANQLKNEIEYLEKKNNFNVDKLKENHEQFSKEDRLIVKSL